LDICICISFHKFNFEATIGANTVGQPTAIATISPVDKPSWPGEEDVPHSVADAEHNRYYSEQRADGEFYVEGGRAFDWIDCLRIVVAVNPILISIHNAASGVVSSGKDDEKSEEDAAKEYCVVYTNSSRSTWTWTWRRVDGLGIIKYRK
jgi:hypothetical protein